MHRKAMERMQTPLAGSLSVCIRRREEYTRILPDIGKSGRTRSTEYGARALTATQNNEWKSPNVETHVRFKIIFTLGKPPPGVYHLYSCCVYK